MSERTIENVREYNLDPKEVIAGLNGYYESDKCNGYITVRRNDVEGPAYFTAALYLSALIEWLRVDHDIFYRPGLTLDQVEAARSAAKMCCLRATIKNGFNKRGLFYPGFPWRDKEADIPELVEEIFKAYDECSEARDRNRKDATKLSEVTQELRKELNTLKDTVSKVRIRLNKKFCALGYEEDLEKLVDIALRGVEARDETINRLTRPRHDECEDIMNYIRQESSRNGFELPEEIDGEPLTVKRVFHDLLELLRMKETKIKETRKKHWNDLRDIYKALGRDGTCDSTDGFAKAVKARAEYLESLSRSTEREVQKSDINNLIRDYCTKNDVTPPSPYFSDKACVEYLFSVVDLERRHRAAVGKQMVDNYEKDLLKFVYKEYEDRIRLSNETITYNPPSVRNTVLKIISDYARCRTRVDILETRIKSIFDKGKTKFTVDDYVLDGDPTTMFMLDCISSWIGSPAESRGKVRAEIENYKLKLKDYILHDIKEHGYQYDGLEKKSIEDIVDWIITMATCANKEVEDAQKETKQECYDYLWNALKKLSPECDALKIDCYENLVDRIFYEMSLINDNCKRCQRKHSTEKFDYIRNIQRANKAEEEVKKLNDVIKKQKELLNEINKEEENEWFKP